MAKKKAENKAKITALYCRLSVEETKDSKDKRKKKQEDESNSISNQKQILLDYAKQNGYLHTEFFVDDGVYSTDPLGNRTDGIQIGDYSLFVGNRYIDSCKASFGKERSNFFLSQFNEFIIIVGKLGMDFL